MPKVEISGVVRKDDESFLTEAILIAKKTCIALGTTPEQAARNLLDTLDKHGGHTGGLYPMTLGELLMSPELLIGQATGVGWLEDLTTERLAAVLWVGAQQQRSKVDSVGSFDMGWALSKIATAIEFPKTRTRIYREFHELHRVIVEAKGRTWFHKKQSASGKASAEAKHSAPGGSRDKRSKIREIWATGKYTSRDICAEQECAALNMSFASARKALNRTPKPPSL